MTGQIALNARFLVHRPTGMQRYATELAQRFGERLDCLRPAGKLTGAKGHMWEQCWLPLAVGSRLLWSPNSTGPLAVPHQVCTCHDTIPLEHPEWFQPRFAAWYGWLLPRLMRSVSHVIAISEFTKSRIVELCRVPEQKITVVPNGVDERFRPQSAGEVERMRAALGLPDGEYLLSVGSLEPRKNVAGLLEAWRRVCDTLPRDLHLVICGAEGSSQVFARANAAVPAPRVRWTGYVDDTLLPALYSGAKGFVYPSLYEGFGLPVLEAVACGTPVVTSRRSAMEEAAGGAAILVNAHDPASIAEGIEALVAGDGGQKVRRKRGLAHAAANRWEKTAQSTWQVLRRFA